MSLTPIGKGKRIKQMNNIQRTGIGLGIASLAVYAMATMPQGGCCSTMNMQGSQTAPTQAKVDKGIQKATVTINGGYSPSNISVKVGQPVQLTFKRTEKSGCGGEVVIKDLKFDKSVESGQSIVFKFTPKKVGKIAFTCGMGMLHGTITVTGVKS